MRRLALPLAPLVLLFTLMASSAAQAIPVQVASQAALGPDSLIDWSVLGIDYDLTVTPSAQAGGVTIGTDAGSVTRLTSGPSYFGNFATGTALLYSGDPLFGPIGNSLTFSFASAVYGVGLAIEAVDFGAYTASVALYNGATLLNSFAVGGNNTSAQNGSVPFLGALSNIAEITSAVFTITSFTNGGGGFNGFAVSGLAVNTGASARVPEPGTLGLMLLGGAIVGARARRRRARPTV